MENVNEQIKNLLINHIGNMVSMFKLSGLLVPFLILPIPHNIQQSLIVYRTGWDIPW